MIFNKYLSLILTACFFMLLMLITSSVAVMFLQGISLTVAIAIVIVIFWRISRMFYNYLRNDEVYKNNRKRTTDKKGEKYLIKGEKDSKKIFIVVWLIVILLLAAISLWLYSLNHGLV